MSNLSILPKQQLTMNKIKEQLGDRSHGLHASVEVGILLLNDKYFQPMGRTRPSDHHMSGQSLRL